MSVWMHHVKVFSSVVLNFLLEFLFVYESVVVFVGLWEKPLQL
jgi:hypothetical protein